jgi:dCTP deaminase
VKLPPGREGVLPNQLLREAIDTGVISSTDPDSPIPDSNLQPASLDLRLGEVAYRIRCSFLPDREPVERKMKPLIDDEIPLTGESVLLDHGSVYLIPLKEQLRLPAGMRAKANPKSSTGRIDVFTRVITDCSHRFDEIEDGYEGRLYLEVVPLSFPIRVRQDLTLNQVRLSVGRTALSDDEVRAHHAVDPILFDTRGPVPDDDLALSNGLFLGLDLRGDGKRHVGYIARENTKALDLTHQGPIDPKLYWDAVHRTGSEGVVLSPRRFYLLMSDEAVAIPPNLAAEMTAYDPTSGELRTHYAGFFDPGFGYDRDARVEGSRAALEVRAHDVPFLIETGQRVCKLTFERMLTEPLVFYGETGARSSYQHQQDALGKHFQPWTPPMKSRAPRPAPDDDQLRFPADGE